MMIEKSAKWDKFRQEKQVVIDEYCQIKRKQVRITSVIKQMFLNSIINEMSQIFKKAVKVKHEKNCLIFINIVICK